MVAKSKPLSSLYGSSLIHLIEMDRLLDRRGLVLCEYAERCEITRSTAGRYLRWIVLYAGLPLKCKFTASGNVLPGIEAIDIRGRGKRIWKYDNCRGLFTHFARRQVRASLLHR